MDFLRRNLPGTSVEKQFWMPDATAIQCYDCGLPFTTFRRKHHCRICGQIFCTECCNETIDAKLLKRSTTERLLRVCKYCYKEVIRSVLPNQTTESVPTTPTTVSYSKRFFHSMIGRRLSSSSVSDIVRSTHLSATETDSRNNCDKEECAPGSPNTRPFSSASIHCDQTFSPSFDRRESLNTTPTFDALRDLMAKMDETMDASEPNWVKEIQESKQTNNESDDAIGDDFVQVATESDGFEKIIGPKRYFFLGNEDDEDDDDLFGSKSENIQVYKLPFSSNETVVRYSPSASVKPDEMATESATEVSSSSESSQSLPRQLSMASFYKNLLSNGKFLFENEDEEVDGFRSATTNIEQPKQLSDLSLDSRPLLFDAIYDRHTNRLLQEILIEEGLSLDWLTVLNDIAKKIANTVTLNHHAYMYSVDNYYQLYSEAPETKTYPMDIRQRVKIKSIPCGSKLDCSIVNGVVFNKNVANRNMRTSIDNPQILLFACSIGYDERRRSLTSNSTTSVKLTMFDSMRLQESNYILNLVAKIESLKPDVIFVQGSVSQTALELLLDKKITVILNVKLSLLERIALFTGTYLIYSPETILNTTRVGKCGKFRIQEFVISESSSRLPNELARGSVAKKSLMFLEGCSESTGCTVLLRGSLLFEEFRKVKNILKYMVYVHYNSRLEKTFHQIVNCLPIEEGEWSSPNELFQFVIRGRQRILSAKSVRSADGDAATEESKPLKPRLTSVVDNSDPLRAFKDEQEPKTVPTLVDSVSEKLQQILPKLILSCSPCITFPVTFLMSANIYQRSSLRFYFSNQLLQSNRLAEETETPPKCADSHRKDGDFVNFLYLLASQNATDTELNSLMPSEWPKLATLRNTLGMRYMVTKSHPLLLNNDYDFKKQSQQFLADFRASGPNVSVRPELFTRSETKSNSKPAPIVDPLSNQAQQSISVQFSLFSPQSENVPNYCFKPKIIDIHYYGKNDMSLGAFLFRHFFFRVTRFNQTQETAAAAVEPEAYMASMANSTMSRKIICPNENCSVSMFRHVMRFTHHKGTVTVLLNKIQDSGQVNMPHQILTWSFCLHCKHKSSYAQMSLDALALSFGKFLELKFYANRHYDYNRYFKEQNSCRHLFHKECYQFFSYDQLIVIFKFDSIVVREIVTPAPIIPITRNHFSKIDLVNHLKELTIQCNDTFQRIVNTIETIQLSTGNKNLTTSTALANLTLEQADQQILEDFLLKLKKEEEDFAASVKEIHLRISTPEAGEFDVVELFRIHNSVSRMKKLIAERVCTWNEKINEFVLSRRRNPDKLTSFMTRLLPTDSLFSNSSDSKTETNKDETEDGRELDCVNHNDSGYSNGSDETEGVQSPPNKLTNLTSKVISKVTTKTADSENLTTSTSSFASRFLPKTTEENFVNIELPFDNGKSTQMLEHYQLPTYKDIAIIVRNKDPGSIIAYAMTTPEYEQKLTEIRNRLKELKNDGANDSVLSSPPKVRVLIFKFAFLN